MAWDRFWVLAAGLLLGLAPGTALAQLNPTLGEAERGIRDADAKPTRHLRIDEFRIAARVAGRTADVTLELTIGSDSDTPYEANLALAMPGDAVVTGYALNVGDAMIPGNLLEAPKARNIYEDEVRAGVDPGLAEVTAGNVFTTRIFPIDRGHPRRFRLHFSAPFDPARGLVLPLSRDAAIGKVILEVAVAGHDSAPVVRFAGAPLMLGRDGKGWRGNAIIENAGLPGGLEIEGLSTAPMLVAQHASGEKFFVIGEGAKRAPARQRPGRLRIYWDRSLSHGHGQADEIEALVRLTDTTAPSAIDVVSFASDRPRVVTLRGGAALRRALDGMVYRGGTSLAGLDGVNVGAASRCVLVFDGKVTIDIGAEFAPDCPLSVMTGSATADGARLGRIAQGTGGRLIRVAKGKAADAAAALADSGIGVVSVRDEAGRRLQYRALPARPGSWLLVGPMPDRGGVNVRLSDGSQSLYATTNPVVKADAPGALWAAQQVQALGDDPSRHRAMVDFARRYQVAGPAMSFLVLERPDQYLRAEIAPPAGFPEDWMRDYRTQKADTDKRGVDERKERFDFVLEQWQDRKSWWNQRFAAKRRVKRDRDEPVMSPPMPVASPTPMSAPEPLPQTQVAEPVQRAPGVAMERSSSESSIVVTGVRARSPNLSSAMAVQSIDAISAEDIGRFPDGRPGTHAEVGLDLADLASNRPYMVALAAAAPGARLKVLAEQERKYGEVPSFYLDVAEWFRLKGDSATADLLLLSALELPLSDDETRQIVAFRLERDRAFDRAVELAEHLAANNAEFRPQPARDLALALAARGRGRGTAGRADLERAFALLTDAALNPASRDFDGFEVIALMEANALIPDIKALGGSWTLDPRLVSLLDTDARIVIEWTADDADIDLWVDEPNGERVYYGDKLSSAGGQISNDMTDGYGPEEYAIRRAPAGNYAVRINGYDADRINPNGPGHVLIRLIRNFGRAAQKDVMVDLDLSFQEGRDRNEEDETRPVATLRVGP